MGNGKDAVIVFNKMSPVLISRLELLRELLGKPILITSSYRSEKYNKDVGGSPRSMHLTGKAVDIDITRYDGETRRKLVSIALAIGLTVGVAKSFIHLDVRDKPTFFGY